MKIYRYENKVDERPSRCFDCANKIGHDTNHTGLIATGSYATVFKCTMGNGIVFNIDHACGAVVIKEKV